MNMSHQCAALTLFAAIACSAATSRGATSHRRASNVITSEEIQAASGGTAFDVVQSLRPNWLVVRGVSSELPLMVYIDGGMRGRGGVELLGEIMATEVLELRWYGASDANVRFGRGGHWNGAIEVITRP